MRRSILLALTTVLLAFPLQAGAEHAPKRFCSETGDVCQEVRGDHSDFRFVISTTSKFFSRYRLCVKDPDGRVECHRFRMREGEGGTYFGKVNWLKNFQAGPAGDYTVVWKVGGERLGAKLGFHTLPG